MKYLFIGLLLISTQAKAQTAQTIGSNIVTKYDSLLKVHRSILDSLKDHSKWANFYLNRCEKSPKGTAERLYFLDKAREYTDKADATILRIRAVNAQMDLLDEILGLPPIGK